MAFVTMIFHIIGAAIKFIAISLLTYRVSINSDEAAATERIRQRAELHLNAIENLGTLFNEGEGGGEEEEEDDEGRGNEVEVGGGSGAGHHGGGEFAAVSAMDASEV